VEKSKPYPGRLQVSGRRSGMTLITMGSIGMILGLFPRRPALPAREKDATSYGMGLIVNVPFPEDEVAQVVQEVIQNGFIRGTKEYHKDEYIAGANPASSTRVFPEWTESMRLFVPLSLLN